MNNLTIGKRIAFGFTIVLVLVTILAAVAVVSLRTIHKTLPMVTEESLPGVANMGTLDVLRSDIELDCARFLLVTKVEDKQTLEAELQVKEQTATKAMNDYEATIHQEEDRQNFKQLQEAFGNWTKAIPSLFELSRAGKPTDDYRAKVLVPAYAATTAACDKMFKWNVDHGVTGAAKIDHVISQASIVVTTLSVVTTLVGIACACLIAISVGRVLMRLSDTLGDGASQVVAAAGQVSASSQSLAEGSSEQAASIEETSSSLEEMASMTRRNADNARNANDLAKQAREAADKGAGDMQTMSAAMEAIKVSSNDISKIIKTIDEIAFQTNILALNAAVEAARAGEAGMGFAVVADEVRSLAQRSAAAAKETADKIEGAIAKTGQGVEINSKVAAALNDIVAKVRQVDELVTEVANASREQTEGITQINTAVGQMDKVTQSNASNAEESAAAAEELNAQAGVLKQSVGELLQLVGSTGRSGVSQPAQGSEQYQTSREVVSPAKRHAPTHNSNGRAPAMTTGKKRDTIPMDGDFKDF